MAHPTSKAPVKTTNKDHEPWCPTCGTVWDAKTGNVARPGNRPHSGAC